MSQELPKSFDALIQESELPVLVDFWAEWCGACKMVSPVIAQIAKAFKGRLITIKVNVDKKQHLAARYQTTSIPTIILFHRGKVLMRQTGALPFDALQREIEKVIS